MVCDICGKNQATVHLTEIIDDQTNELHLCEECAHKKSTQMEQQFGLSDLLAGLTEFQKPSEVKEAISLKCPGCGLSFKDFKKIGRLGCSMCYSTFKKYLATLLKRIHGSNVHHGKVPLSVAKAAKEPGGVEELRSKLHKAIDSEQYEEAARLRDQIRQMQEQSFKQDKEQKDAP
jgi:protein arginine kinase activator